MLDLVLSGFFGGCIATRLPNTLGVLLNPLFACIYATPKVFKYVIFHIQILALNSVGLFYCRGDDVNISQR